MSIELVTKVEKKVSVKTVFVTAKVCDMGNYNFRDDYGDTVKELDDCYVPNFFPEDHCGDYLQLEIELSTGKILNWKAPTERDLKNLFSEEDE